MSPIQQMLLGVGAVATKTYVDDLFNTFLYKGDGSTSHTINTGLDLSASSDGGMVWFKSRSSAHWHSIFDTVRGANKAIYPNDSWEQESLSNTLNSFNNNGFTVGYNSSYSSVFTNANNDDYASWTFRKAPGFFDVVTYTGNGSARTIAHSLKSVPGMILIKKTSASDPWNVYHRSLDSTSPENYRIFLDESDERVAANTSIWNQTKPTSTHFSLGTNDQLNGNGATYVAYVFAGGESTAATARSVDFDGTGDYLVTNSSSDYDLGTGDFTCELWFMHRDNSNDDIVERRSANPSVEFDINVNNNQINVVAGGTSQINSRAMPQNQWYHIALVRHSATTTLYLNGIPEASFSDTNDYNNTEILIGTYMSPPSYELNGKMSNLRLVKGTAVYTSAFRPSTEPLTNISGTVLLCCNNSSVTGTTVGTVTSGGNPTASTDSPFDDPAGFKFGDAGDQNVIKCGSHSNSAAENIRIYTGWEPQWIMTKNASVSSNWAMFDCIRGMFVDVDMPSLAADVSNAENGVLGANKFIFPHPDGFTMKYGGTAINPGNGNTILYIAIRRPDGYVGKPVELGTDVFAMDTGNNSFPAMDTGFPVDFGLAKKPATTDNWRTGGRLTGTKALYTNATDAQSNHVNQVWDSNVGFWKSIDSSFQAWAWKRHAGFDVVNYVGNQTSGHHIAHSLGKTPEMIWLKNRDQTQDWGVGHKGLNGGTNPWNYYSVLNISDAEQSDSNYWDDTAPTATHFTVGSNALTNKNTHNYIAMLFASVDGISKVGYYNGTGSSGHSITTGFQPRFIVIKAAHRADGYGGGWHEFDTLRGINSGNEYPLTLNSDAAESAMNHLDYIDLDSDGFTIQSTSLSFNGSNARYIYYAHA